MALLRRPRSSFQYLKAVHALFGDLRIRIVEEIPKRLAEAEARGSAPSQRGATWTYLTTDQALGSLSDRILSGLRRKARTRRFWG